MLEWLFWLIIFPLSDYVQTLGCPFLTRITIPGTFVARKQGIEAFLREPAFQSLFGNGLGTSGLIVSPKFGLPGTSSTHNAFLDLIYELGWVGAVLFLLFTFTFFFRGWSALRMTNDEAPGCWL